MTRRRRPAPPPPAGVLARWTVLRATVSGIVLGIAATLVAAASRSWPDLLLYPYLALLLLTLFCGLSILWISMQDARRRHRGERVRPIRTFDLAAGLVLALPSAYALWLLWPSLGL